MTIIIKWITECTSVPEMQVYCIWNPRMWERYEVCIVNNLHGVILKLQVIKQCKNMLFKAILMLIIL